LTLDKHAEQSRELVERLSQAIGRDLAGHILDALQKDEADIYEQRQSSTTEDRLQTLDSLARNLLSLADNLVRVGLDVGRDGWA
jgi:pyruvate-ferredoxin/flavodoxin oxidoreductase